MRIGEVVEPVRVWDPRRARGWFRYVDVGAVDQATKRITGDRLVPCAGAPSRARRLVCTGDVLVSTVRPNLNGVARVGPGLDGATASTGLCVLRPSARVDGRYLFHWVRTPGFVADLTRRATGQSYPAVSDRIIKESWMPLPPLPEQRRIAVALSRADELLESRRRAGRLLGELAGSLFADMFGDPVVNPRGWRTARLGSLATVMADGPFGSHLRTEHYTASGVRVVRLQNIGAGDFLDHDRAYVSEEHFASLGRRPCRPGDILVATLGDPNPRACLQPPWLDRALNKADCVQLRADETIVTAAYLCAALNMPGTTAAARRLARGQTRMRISVGRLRTLEIPVPPLPDQLAYARRVAAVDRAAARNRAAEAAVDGLLASARDRMFSRLR